MNVKKHIEADLILYKSGDQWSKTFWVILNIKIQIKFFTSPITVNLYPSGCFSFITDRTPVIFLDFFMLEPSLPMASPIKVKGTINISVYKTGYKIIRNLLL